MLGLKFVSSWVNNWHRSLSAESLIIHRRIYIATKDSFCNLSPEKGKVLLFTMYFSVDLVVLTAHFQIAVYSKMIALLVNWWSGTLNIVPVLRGVFTLTSVFTVTVKPDWNVPASIPQTPVELEMFVTSPACFSFSFISSVKPHVVHVQYNDGHLFPNIPAKQTGFELMGHLSFCDVQNSHL